MTNVGYHIRNGWLQKPPLGVQLNWAHPLTKGLVGCWLFNEGGGDKAYDLSGYNNHGTLNNMAFPPTTASGWNAGKDGVGLTFDGSNDYINCENGTSLDITDAVTISAWVKPAGTGGGAIFNNRYEIGGLDTGWFFGLFDSDNKLVCDFNENIQSDATYQSDANAYTVDEWVFVCLTKIGPSAIFYVNGLQFGNAVGVPATIVYDAGTTHRYIGNSEDGGWYNSSGVPDHYFDGAIDEVWVYNRALTAFDIGWLYREPYAMFEPATKYTIIDERLATDYVGGNVMAAELI